MEIAKLLSNGRDRHWAVDQLLMGEMGLMFVTIGGFCFWERSALRFRAAPSSGPAGPRR